MRALLLCASLLALGCTDRTDDDVRAQASILLGHEGALAQRAADRLVGFGRKALPTLESALHTAQPDGKKTIIVVIRRIADPDAVPLIAHLASYDPALDVRREAEWTLRTWVKDGAPALADRARAALRQVEEQRQSEEAG